MCLVNRRLLLRVLVRLEAQILLLSDEMAVTRAIVYHHLMDAPYLAYRLDMAEFRGRCGRFGGLVVHAMVMVDWHTAFVIILLASTVQSFVLTIGIYLFNSRLSAERDLLFVVFL